MGIVIDTNVFINVENGCLNLSKLSAMEHHGESYIAAVTASELLTGVHLARTADIRVRRSAFVESIISQIPILEFDEAVSRTYAEIYSHFLKPRSKKEGNVHDLQIAATAITHGFPVLTNNLADFKKIPGINLEGI